MTEREKVTDELIRLKAAVARANATTMAEFESQTRSVQKLVFLMAELKDQVAFYTALPILQERETVEKTKQWGYDETLEKRILEVEEIHHHSALSERERVQKVDELRRRIDTLNDLLESLNHTTRL